MTLGARFDEVLAAAREGADWAVAALFEDLDPPLLRFLRAQAPGVADDLAGEVWLAMARRLPSFEGDEGALRGWVFLLARRQLVGHWRKAGRRRTDPVAPEDLAERAGAGGDPATIVVDGLDAQAAVDRLVAGLSPDQAQVVLLRVVAGLSVEQVAEIMGKRAGTVRVLQHRALRRLARQLGGER